MCIWVFLPGNRMSTREFVIIKPCEPREVDEPLGVFRIIRKTTYSDLGGGVLVDDRMIEDPNIDNFFFVLADLDRSEFIVYFEGQYWLAKVILENKNGNKFFDLGYVNIPYVPLADTGICHETS